MPRKLLKRYMPSAETVRAHPSLRFMERWMHMPALWHITRHSAARACLIGFFWAFVPMPFQMIPAALCALWLQANLPLSIGLVWITNPLTMPPILYASYSLGCWTLGTHLPLMEHFNAEALLASLGEAWQPLLVGSLMLSVTLSLASYGGLHLFWRMHTARRWRERCRLRQRAHS